MLAQYKVRIVRLVMGVFFACGLGCSATERIEGFPDEYVGIGVELTMRQGVPMVVKPLDGGSAARAGVLAGDYIVAINEVSVQHKSLGDVVALLRGRPTTEVTLTVERGKLELTLTLIRGALSRKNDHYKARP